jgi:hypothetical protein
MVICIAMHCYVPYCFCILSTLYQRYFTKHLVFMKKVFFLLFILAPFLGSAQYVHSIKADTLLVSNDSCNAELILENGTKNIKGFLFNKGNGRTEFRQAVISLGNGEYLIGADTLRAVAGSRPVQLLTDQSVVNWNLSNGSTAEVKLKGNRTLSLSNVTNGSEGRIIIVQDSMGNRKLTLPSNSYNMDEGNGLLALSTIAGAIDIASFIYDGSRYYWTLHKNYTAVPRSASFNFNMTPQYVPGWTDISGNPHAAVRTATDYATGIGISSIATNKWVEWGGNTSAHLGENDPNPVFVFPPAVTLSYWFNSSNTYSTSADCNIELNGLEVGGRYNIEILSSRESADIAQPNRYMRAVCVDSTSTTIVDDFDAKRNTANLMMFTNKAPNSSGKILFYIGKRHPNDGNHPFGYINGLRVTKL